MKKIIALILATVVCLSLVACGNNSGEDDATPTTEAVQTTGAVTLTAENFETYFEFCEESFFTKDASGNYAHLRYRHYYKLKEEFNMDESKSSIKLSYGYTQSTKGVTIDFANQKFTLGEQIGETKTYENIEINKFSKMTYKDYAVLLLQPTHAVKGDTQIMYFSDFKLNSVEGTLFLIEKPVINPDAHTHAAE